MIDNTLVRIHYITVIIKCTGLAPWEFECPFLGSLTSTFLLELVSFLLCFRGMATLVSANGPLKGPVAETKIAKVAETKIAKVAETKIA